MKSSIEKDEYVRRLALDLDLKEVQIYDEIKRFKLPAYHPARMQMVEKAKVNTQKRSVSEILLGFMIEFPRIGRLFVEKLDEDCFSDDLKAIYKAFADQYNIHSFESVTNIIDDFPHEIKEKAGLLSLYVSEKYGEISEVDVEKELNALFGSLHRGQLDLKRKDLQRRLQVSEKEDNRELSTQLLQQLNELNTQTLK